MGVFVKICGCASGGDVEAVAAMRPDALGFILWPGSKRYVNPQQIADWTATVPSDILRAGVFVDAEVDEIRSAVDVAGLDVVQLHGNETAQMSHDLQPVRCWKVVHLNRPLAGNLSEYELDAFLLDYHGGVQPGGTGQTVDWAAAKSFVDASKCKVVLAGGLNPANVQGAIRQVGPWGVDVSSGVEQEPGRKDLAKVKDFIEQCRAIA